MSCDNYHWAYEEELFLLPEYLKAIGDTENKIILDVGCGSGWITEKIARGAKRVVGIDLLRSLIHVAKQHHNSGNINYKQLNAKEINTLEGDFDIITSALVMQLFTPKELFLEILKKCHSKLKERGKMVILVPHPCFINHNKRPYNEYIFNNFSYFNDQKEYTARLKTSKGKISFTSNFYNLSTYSSLFNQAGFVIESIIEPKLSNELLKNHPTLWTLEKEMPFYIIFSLAKSILQKTNH